MPSPDPGWRLSRTAELAERSAVALGGLVLAVVLVVVLAGPTTADDGSAAISAPNVGLQYADQGDQLLAPGSRVPAYDSVPPTSGPHVPVPVRRDEVTLGDNQILQALAAGDVVVLYGTPRPPAGLRELAVSQAGPFSPALAAAGQAIILAHRPGIRQLLALAWTRMLRPQSARDPLLRQFIELYLGQRRATRLRSSG